MIAVMSYVSQGWCLISIIRQFPEEGRAPSGTGKIPLETLLGRDGDWFENATCSLMEGLASV